MKLNKTTQKAQRYIYDHTRAYLKDQYYLWNVYGSYSVAKINAYNYCIDKMLSYNGYSGSIVSYNQFTFTYGFKYQDQEGQEHLYIICKCNEYDITL